MSSEPSPINPFEDASGRPRRVWGVAVYSASPRVAELACRVGYDAVWIEMEHGPTDFRLAEAICYATKAHGGTPLIRLPDASRNFVLKAAEVGAQILIVPMVNNAEMAAEIVKHAKFPPVGSRGMNANTPGTEYGLRGLSSVLAETNDRIHLFAQIETREAIDNLDAICQVEGLAGTFIGPSDLSVDLGIPGQFDDPEFTKIILDVIERTRAAGKLAGILLPPGKLLQASVDAGAQMLVVGSDVSSLKVVWPELLEKCSANAPPL